MNYNRIKDVVFSNDFILKFISYTPKVLLYSKDYFKVIKALKTKDLLSGVTQQDFIINFQKKRLKKILIESLLNVPYYKETVPIKASEIDEDNSFEVLKQFPYLSKKEVMDNQSAFLNRRFNKKNLFYGTSGGSTGQGIGLWRTKREYDVEKAFYEYHWKSYGYIPFKSRIVRIGGDSLRKKSESPTFIKGSTLYISPYHINREHIEEIYQKLIEFNPDVIHAYPSSIDYISKYLNNNSLYAPSVRGIVLGSEMLTKSQYLNIKNAFKCPISHSYGLTERCLLGLFKDNQDYNDEINFKLDPIYGISENRVNKFGSYELVGTSLWNITTPLIRYRTQDMGKIEDGVISNLTGRSQEYLVAKNGDYIPGFSVSIGKFIWKYIETYQVYQNEPGKVILRLIPKKSITKDILNIILVDQQTKWGDFFDLTIEIVNTIPKTKSGKTKLVLVEL